MCMYISIYIYAYISVCSFSVLAFKGNPRKQVVVKIMVPFWVP